MAKDIRSGKFYEAELYLLPYLVPKASIAIDIGSNYGLYSYHLSNLVGGCGKVYGFEPIPITFNTLSKVLKILSITNITITKQGLSNFVGSALFEVPLQDGGHLMGGQAHLLNSDSINADQSSKSSWRNTKTFECQVNVLDRVIPNDEKHRVSFIKLDTEGCEFLILDGALETITASKATLLIEINPQYLEYFKISLAASLEKLAILDYKLYSYKETSRSLVIISDSEIVEANYIFIHNSNIKIVDEINSKSINPRS